MAQQVKGTAYLTGGAPAVRHRALPRRGALRRAVGLLFALAPLGTSGAPRAYATSGTISTPISGTITVGAGETLDIIAGGSITVGDLAPTVRVEAGGTLNLSGGSVIAGLNSDGVELLGGTFNLTAGSITAGGGSTGIEVLRGTANISGGAVTAGQIGVHVATGTVNMTGGSVSSSLWGMSIPGGMVTITGGSVSGTIIVSLFIGASVGGTLDISGGVNTGVAVDAGGTATISGGLINVSPIGTGVNVEGGTATISGGSLNLSPGELGLLLQSGSLTVSGCNLRLSNSPGPNYQTLTGTLLDGTSINTTSLGLITLDDHCAAAPPVANAGSDQTVEATGRATPVTLDGSGSSDADGDALTYMWSEGSTALGSGQKLGASLTLGEHTITLTVADPSGNSATASVKITIVDTTPPAIAVPGNLTAEATGPNGATVSFSPTAQDLVDGTVSVTCTPASGSTFPLGTTTVACTATDAHGNEAKASFTVTVQDTTPPVITVPGDLTATAMSASGAVVSFTASATDLVDGSVAVTASPVSGSIFPPGATTVHCTATDAHGNVGSASFAVSVAYDWSGFLAPINPDGSSVFKLGSTVPVKFQLTGASAAITDAVARLSYAKVSDGVAGDVNAADSTSAATAGNLFRYDPTSGQYIFNWSTQGLTTGTYQLQIDLGDGVPRMVNVGLK